MHCGIVLDFILPMSRRQYITESGNIALWAFGPDMHTGTSTFQFAQSVMRVKTLIHLASSQDESWDMHKMSI